VSARLTWWAWATRGNRGLPAPQPRPKPVEPVTGQLTLPLPQ
jgi:hypothetical protein